MPKISYKIQIQTFGASDTTEILVSRYPKEYKIGTLFDRGFKGNQYVIRNIEPIIKEYYNIRDNDYFKYCTKICDLMVAKMKFAGSDKIYHYYINPSQVRAQAEYLTNQGKKMYCTGFVFPWESRATVMLPAGRIGKTDNISINARYFNDEFFKFANCIYHYPNYIVDYRDGEIVFDSNHSDQCIKIIDLNSTTQEEKGNKKFTYNPCGFFTEKRIEKYLDKQGIYNFFDFLKKMRVPEYLLGRIMNILAEKGYEWDNGEEAKNTPVTSTQKPLGYGSSVAQCNNNNNNNNNKEKEKDNMMNNIFKNIRFGKISTDKIKFSMNGIAFKDGSGAYHTYNIETNTLTDVSAFTVDMDFVFEVPVAIKDIADGDIVNHKGRYVIIKDHYEDGSLAAIDPIKAEEITILPIKNVFGFNYVSKVLNVFEGFKADSENPFGNINSMLPLMMISDNKGDNSDMFKMMMLMNAANGSEGAMNLDFTKNPLMLMAFCK